MYPQGSYEYSNVFAVGCKIAGEVFYVPRTFVGLESFTRHQGVAQRSPSCCVGSHLKTGVQTLRFLGLGRFVFFNRVFSAVPNYKAQFLGER